MNDKKVKSIVNDSKVIGVVAIIISVLAINISLFFNIIFAERVEQQKVTIDSLISNNEFYEQELAIIKTANSLQNVNISGKINLAKADIYETNKGTFAGNINISFTNDAWREIIFDSYSNVFLGEDDEPISDNDLIKMFTDFMTELDKAYELYLTDFYGLELGELTIKNGTFTIYCEGVAIATWEKGKIVLQL